MKVIAKPIQVVAWFNEKGSINPVRFKLCNEDEKNITIKINKILFTNKENLAGNKMIVYKCQSIINGIEKLYELKYEINSCKWMLFKI
jgi:hypothetical protein